MTQTWDPQAYAQNAAFVPGLAGGVLQGLPEALRATFVDETVALLAPVLRDQAGHWTAGYVRLRFIAMAV